MTKEIIGIWAEDRTGLIGAEGHLPWYLPRDLAHFKSSTMNQAILMGRKTFDGMKGRLLPHRQTIVMTRKKEFEVEGALVVHSREELLNWYNNQEKSLFIIGGAEIFKIFYEDFAALNRTIIDAEFKGETYFPSDFPFENFVETKTEYFAADEKNAYDFTITKYSRLSDK